MKNVIRYAILLSFLVVFGIAVASSTKTGTIPMEDIMRPTDFLGIKISPDGKYLAGRVRQNNEVSLVVFDAITRKIVGGLKPNKGEEIYNIRWANNERILFEYAIRDSFIDSPVSTGELFAVNFDGSKKELLFGYRASKGSGGRIKKVEGKPASQSVLSLLVDDNEHILIEEYDWGKTVQYPMISKLNIYTGKRKKVERIPYPRPFVVADKKGNIRFVSWSDKQDKVHVVTREKKGDDWQEFTVDEGVSGDFRPLWINKAGDKVYLGSQIGTGKRNAIQEMDLNTGGIHTVFADDVVDVSDVEVDIDSDEAVVGVVSLGQDKYLYRDDVQSATAELHKRLVKAFPGQNVNFFNHTRDGSKIVVSVSSDINPGEFYIFDTKANKADFLWAVSSWLNPAQLQSMQVVNFTARDGLSVHGLLTLPKKQKGKQPPLLVIVHGGPHGPFDRWGYNSEVQLFANRGYAVLQVNFRGSGGFGKAYEEKGYRQWGGEMINDIIDGTEWAIKEYNLNKDKVCIYGASYGGYGALMSAAMAPDLYKCSIGYVGVYDLNIMFSTGDIPDNWGGLEYLEKVLGRDKQELTRFSPTSHADKITADVMLIHGAKDKRAPIKHSYKMRSALQKAGKEPVWLKYKYAGHGVRDTENSQELYQKVLDFMQQCLANK